MNREDIYNELLNLVSSVADFKTVSRRLKHWDDVSPADMPALFISDGDEDVSTIRGMPSVWTLTPDINIFVDCGNNQNITPYSILNPILDKVCALFDDEKSLYGVQTLNGKCDSAKLNGKILKDGGLLDTKAVAVISIEIKATN